MTLSTHQLRRTLTVAAALPVPQARAIVALIVASASLPMSGAEHRLEADATTIQCGARIPKRAALAAKQYAKRVPVIDRMKSAIDRQLGYAKSETLRNLEHGALSAADEPLRCAGAAADIVFDKKKFSDGILAAMRKESAEAMQIAGQEMLGEVGKFDPFTMPPADATRFLDRRINKMKDIPGDMHREIMDELTQGVKDGESMKKLSRRISEKFDEISAGRANTIASTETSAAYGYARNEAQIQAGITRRQWLISGFPASRAAHLEVDGQIRGMDEPFTMTGPGGEEDEIMYPGDEDGEPWNVINCHCTSQALADEGAEGEEF